MIKKIASKFGRALKQSGSPLSKSQKQAVSDDKARAKYMTDPTRVYNPYVNKYF
jgi:hypothetical protein